MQNCNITAKDPQSQEHYQAFLAPILPPLQIFAYATPNSQGMKLDLHSCRDQNGRKVRNKFYQEESASIKTCLLCSEKETPQLLVNKK